jgi:TonB-dependent receptor
VKNYIILLISLLSISFSFAQKSKVTGKVFNTKNEPLVGVSVKLAGNTVAVTNTDGRYIITVEAGKKYDISFSYIGYEEKTMTGIFVAKVNTEAVVDVVLEVSKKTNSEVTVKSSNRGGGAKGETVNAMIAFQKNTNTVAQVISGEAIRRSPDKNTGEVLKRVPGLSVIDGKYLVVRGLADRYNQAMLNGVLLGSTEPDRKTFSFDIFPSAIIDNIVINKAFIPEMSGEWAGGLVQVNTNDAPSTNFFDIGIATGFNTQTIGKDFYKYQGGKLDWLGFDDGTRALPNGLPTKSDFNNLDQAGKTQYAKQFENIWTANKISNNTISLLSRTFKLSTGFTKNLGKKNKFSGVFALNYSLSPKRNEFGNGIYNINGIKADTSFYYTNTKYAEDVLWGGLANFTLQLGTNNRISVKNIFNVNTTNYTTLRTGKDFETNSIVGDNIRATELAFKANTFFNTQISGDHNLPKYKAKFHWFGSFQILDQYIPDQRRVQYNQDNPNDLSSQYSLLISSSKSSQRTGSRFYGFLSDYNYTTGADISKNFTISNLPQSVKAGYFFQVKDRLYDSRPFAIYLPIDNPALRHLSQDVVFSAENFGNGINNKFAFNEIGDTRYRYLGNAILNAGFIQFDNQIFTDRLRAVWGLRVEDFDQLIGSTNPKDSRFVNIKKTDFLPGANLTYKVNNITNIRLSGSQTVIRPEFRELSSFSFYDFDLGATITGNQTLERTKVTNVDLRYEIYPRAGELFTFGVFFKYFKSPTELFFENTGAGSSATFRYVSPDHAHSYGAEVEFRKRLDFSKALRNFTFQGNIAYIYNTVADLNRPMQGQSPYLINLGLQYDIEKAGLTTTLLFNQIGRRIFYVGGQSQPPTWEAPRPLLDFQIAKKIMKNRGEIKLNVSDIINQAAQFYYDLNENKKYDNSDVLAINRKYGTNVSISFGYKIK